MRCGGRRVTLPRLGTITTHESTRKLARRLENGTARILSATVTRTAQRFFVSFTCEADRAVPGRHKRSGSVIGVDLGVKALLTGADSDGNVFTIGGQKPLRTSLRKLRRASRAHSRKAKGSANRRKHAGKLARIHARVANIRADALHKATSQLASRYETVVLEDLNVAGMTRNRSWPAPSLTRDSARQPGCSATKPGGTAARSSLLAGSSRPARRVRAAER